MSRKKLIKNNKTGSFFDSFNLLRLKKFRYYLFILTFTLAIKSFAITPSIVLDYSITNSKTYSSQPTTTFCNDNTLTFTASTTITDICTNGRTFSYTLVIKNGSNVVKTITNTTGIFTVDYSDPTVAFSASAKMSVSLDGLDVNHCSSTNSNDIITVTDDKTKTFDWTANQIPTSFFTSSSSSVCLGDFFTITTSGNWDASSVTLSGDGIIFPNSWSTSPVPTTAGSKTYTATGNTVNKCPITQTVNVTVMSLPTVSISASQNPACINQAFTLTGSGASSYAWSSGSSNAGLTSTVGSTVSAIPTASGIINYSVIGTGSNGCSNSANINVSIIDGPIPSYTYNINQRTVTFTNTTATYSGPGIVTYLWDFGDGSPIVSTTSIAPQIHTYSNSQSYTATLTARVTPGNCDKISSQIFEIDATPITNFTMPSDICFKNDGNGGSLNTVTFTNTTTSNPTGKQSTFVYDWDFGDGSTLTGQTFSASITHTYSSIGTYTIKLTATNSTGRESVYITKNININPNPIINGCTDYLLTNGHCQGRSIEFKMGTFTSVNYTNYPLKWYMDYDGNNLNGPNSDGYDAYNSATNGTGFSPLLAPFTYTNNTAGTYTIKGKLEVVSTGCITSYTESFTNDPTPTTSIQISPSVTGMCINTSTPPSISSTTAGSAYDWEYTPPSNTVWRPTNQSFNPQGTMLEVGAASLSLKVQNSSGCWSDAATGSFDIWNAPTPSFTNTVVCDKNANPTDFSNTSTGPQTNYSWDFGDNSGTSTLASPNYNYGSAGTYNVVFTVSENNHNCSATVSQNVEVKPNPTVDFSFSPITCEQQDITFSDNSSLSGKTIISSDWAWDDGSYSNTSSQTILHKYIPTFSGSSTSINYNITLTSTASNLCYDMVTKTITIYKRPAAPTLAVATNAQNHTNTICEGEQYTINASPSSGYSYSWFFNGNSMGAFYNNYITDYGVAPLPDSRPYAVRITDNNGCYNTSANSTILVKHVNNYIGYTSGFTTLCPGSTVTLTGSVPTPSQSYEWYKAPYNPSTQTFGSFGLVGTNSKTHLVDNSNEGRYKYKGIINISGGDDCVAESQTIDVLNALPLALNYTGTVNIDVNNPQVLQHIANAYPTYTTFKWYRNGLLESTLATYQVTKPGKYYLIATGDCGVEKSNEVTFLYNCGSPGYNPNYTGTQNFTSGTTTLNTSTVMPTTILMNGDWNISGSAVVNITDLIIVVDNCAKFNVTSGTLNLTNTQIVGCGEWNGIIINGSGSTLNMTGGGISEAVVGITSKNKGTLNVTQAEFDNNNIHIGFSAFGVSNTSIITFNKFGNLDLGTPSCTHPEYPNWNKVNYPMVYLEGVTGPTLSGNEFICSNTSNANEIEGIQSNGSNSLTLSNNSDNGFLSKGIHVKGGSNHNISDNTFSFKFTTPLDIIFSRNAWYKTGIRMVDANGSTIDRNLITNADEGIAFYQNTSVSVPSTAISRNRMETCNWGLVTATKENPATSVLPYNNSSTQMIYLTVSCNTFNYNNYGWIGTGGYSNQGSSSLSNGNSFNGSTYWNTCVAYPSSNYYWVTTNSIENPYGVTANNLSLDGILHTSLNYSTTCIQSPPASTANSCANKRSDVNSETSNEENASEKQISFKSYPNPFTNYLEVTADYNNSGKQFTVRVFDVNGKLLYESNNSESVQIINTENWSFGVYLIQITDNSGLIYYQKMVKTE